MSPLPVIANTYRITLNYATADGIRPVNVFHVRGGPYTDVEVGQQIEGAFVDNMLSPVPARYEPTHLSILRLDGTAATLEYGRTDENALCGYDGSSQAVLEGALCLTLRTGVRGPSGRGRVFIGPVAEAAVGNGLFTGTDPSQVVEAWEEFRTVLNTGPTPMEHVVASYTHAVAREVTVYSASAPMAYQKRRLIASRS